MSGAFAKVAGAKMTGGGNPIKDGNYKFLIEKVFIQNGHTGELFIGELRVIESAPNGAVDELGRPVMPNPAGSQCSLVCNLTKHDAAAGNAKKFIVQALAGLGYTEDKVTSEVIAHVCSEANPLHGVAVADETYRGVNKGRLNAANAGKPLTLNNWRPILQTEDDVVAQRKYLAETKPKVDSAAQAQMAAAVNTAIGAPTQTFAAAASTTPAQQTAAAAPKASSVLTGILGGPK